ncbi:MAG: hypothetical protein RIQ79_277 [Verrucomicrobiota bacterium]
MAAKQIVRTPFGEGEAVMLADAVSLLTPKQLAEFQRLRHNRKLVIEFQGFQSRHMRPGSDKLGITAESYEQLSKNYKKEGNDRIAQTAREKAKALRATYQADRPARRLSGRPHHARRPMLAGFALAPALRGGLRQREPCAPSRTGRAGATPRRLRRPLRRERESAPSTAQPDRLPPFVRPRNVSGILAIPERRAAAEAHSKARKVETRKVSQKQFRRFFRPFELFPNLLYKSGARGRD